MTDFAWPDDLVPYAVSFYLQPHTGGSESPFSRQTKTYVLTAPRWVCSMSFRGGYDGTERQAEFGPRLDAFLDQLGGREHRALIYDFRRPRMRSPIWPSNAGNLAAALDATSLTITGLQSGTIVKAGDYVGGDGRPHRILADVEVGSSGQAVVSFKTPLKAAISANAAIFGNPTGRFMLTDDDAGANMVEVGGAQMMTLNFVEDLA